MVRHDDHVIPDVCIAARSAGEVKISVFPSAESAGRLLASEIAAGIERAHASGTSYVLGCPGGRSPRETYRELARLAYARSLDLRSLHVVMMDDYVEIAGQGFVHVAATMHYSVRRFAAEQIVEPLNAAAAPGRGITNDRLWFPDPAEPARYDDDLAQIGGIDLFILASGSSDGHIAFNPPGTPIGAHTRVVELAESTRRDNLATFPDFSGIDEVPRWGVTVGVGTIIALARRAVMLASGSSKRLTVERLAAADGYDPEWPATVITVCANPSVYADRDAASAIGDGSASPVIAPRH